MDLNNLPRRGKQINWKKSIGCQCSFIYGEISGTITIVDYKFCSKNQKGYILIQYLDKKDWVSTDCLAGCNLGIFLGCISSDYFYNIGENIKDEKRDITIIDRECRTSNTRTGIRKWKWYLISCNKCKRTHWIVQPQLKNGSGCPYCGNNINRLVEGVNDIVTKAPWMISFFQGGKEEAKKYTVYSSKKILPICPICGRKAKKKRRVGDIYRFRSIGCQCDGKLSFPELVLYNILSQNNIDFIPQATKSVLSWANNYRYDFYLPHNNCIIETHGCQHYKRTKLTGRTLEEEKENDIHKRKLAVNNGIENYYELDCRNSSINWIIDNCCNSGLFDFLNINVDDINFDSLYDNKYHEKIKQCKEIVEDDPFITFAELSRQLGFTHYYDTERVLEINRIKVRSNRYPVDLYMKNILYKTYSSISEAARNSEITGNKICANTLQKYITQRKIISDIYEYRYHYDDLNVAS